MTTAMVAGTVTEQALAELRELGFFVLNSDRGDYCRALRDVNKGQAPEQLYGAGPVDILLSLREGHAGPDWADWGPLQRERLREQCRYPNGPSREGVVSLLDELERLQAEKEES